MSKHTKEPWEWGGGTAITRLGRYIHVEPLRSLREASANARRIVACVNSCAGIPTEALEAGVIGEMQAAFADLERTASDVARQGAKTGSQWTLLAAQLIRARSILPRLGGHP